MLHLPNRAPPVLMFLVVGPSFQDYLLVDLGGPVGKKIPWGMRRFQWFKFHMIRSSLAKFSKIFEKAHETLTTSYLWSLTLLISYFLCNLQILQHDLCVLFVGPASCGSDFFPNFRAKKLRFQSASWLEKRNSWLVEIGRNQHWDVIWNDILQTHMSYVCMFINYKCKKG